MKGSVMVYGRHTWESLIEMKEEIYNDILVEKTINDPEYIYIDI